MMQDLLDWQSRGHVHEQVRGFLEQGVLGTAITVIEVFTVQAGDEALLQAALTAAETADVDWVEVCAETIGADQQLRSRGETGCRLVHLELGNQPESRLRVVRRYYGPERIVQGANRPERRLGGHHGILDELMMAAGLEQLAAV